MSPAAPGSPASHAPLPGARNLFAFSFANCLSFSMILGAPMLLYLETSLDASKTVLAIAAAMTPLLNILQIPAASWINNIGYRRFVVYGWLLRSVFIIGLAIVPLLPQSVDNTTRILLMLIFLFLFNAVRGIAVCGLLPWITQLVPDSIRGRFLSKDQMFIAIASIVSAGIGAAVQAFSTSPLAFSALFFWSLATGLVATLFLTRIPDIPTQRDDQPEVRGTDGAVIKSPIGVPWRAIIFYPPFLKLLLYNIVIFCALGPSGPLWVAFFKEHLGASNSLTLGVTGLFFASSLVTLAVAGVLIDRIGSRPLLALSAFLFALHFLGWGAMASGVYPFHWFTVGLQQISAGIAGALFQLANTRLAMATIPEKGRNHFFAVFSVVGMTTMGIAPVLYGMMLDALGTWSFGWEWLQINRYVIFYGGLTLTMILAQVFLHRLDEQRAMPTGEFVRAVLEGPRWLLARLFPRRLIGG